MRGVIWRAFFAATQSQSRGCAALLPDLESASLRERKNSIRQERVRGEHEMRLTAASVLPSMVARKEKTLPVTYLAETAKETAEKKGKMKEAKSRKRTMRSAAPR